MQRKEPVGDNEFVPEEAQNLEALTAETLSVRAAELSVCCCLLQLFLTWFFVVAASGPDRYTNQKGAFACGRSCGEK